METIITHDLGGTGMCLGIKVTLNSIYKLRDFAEKEDRMMMKDGEAYVK